MADKELLERVKTHMGEYLETEVAHLDAGSRLATAVPGIDSMKVFEMILYLEDCFDVEFEEEVMEKIGTLGELVDYIGTRREAPAV